jgi:hypothetical protein
MYTAILSLGFGLWCAWGLGWAVVGYRGFCVPLGLPGCFAASALVGHVCLRRSRVGRGCVVSSPGRVGGLGFLYSVGMVLTPYGLLAAGYPFCLSSV